MTITTKRDWQRRLRAIKAEIPADLRAASKRISQAQRRHLSVRVEVETARRIRTEELRKELRK